MEFSDIKGLGQKRIELLKKAGFNNPSDLLLFFPKKYLDTASLTSVESAKTGDIGLFFGSVSSVPVRKTVRKGLFFVRAEFTLSSGEKIHCIWFNNKYIKNALTDGKEYYIEGKIKRSANRIEISAPNLYDAGYDGKIVSIYPSIAGLPRSILENTITQVLEKTTLSGLIQGDLAKEFSIMPLHETVKTLHRPKSLLDIERARKSAALEILSCQLAIFFLEKERVSGLRFFEYEEKTEQLNNLINNVLPYALTESQTKSLSDIISSLLGANRMNRLLQGDVGSGKTVVALIAMYFAFLNGYQSVLMAPTEILAKQHFETAIKIFEQLGVKICLLTGSQSKNERADKLFNISNGMVDFVIGTHAVIQNDVEFSRLSLIITDEQQRFGVEQRGRLENKSLGTDCLVLSATPIPRTLALILYGELEHSLLERIATKKAETLTRVVPFGKIESMYDYVAQKAELGEKTFIVCPRIEEDEDDELVSAKQLYKELSINKRISPYLQLLHGQMKEEEKSAKMQDFYCGKCRILVSTTVIEVGIDVSDATTIVIFNPERYGLSQLHQLRGRVGRGKLDSYCFLVAGEINDRLDFFLKCNDGFELAEYDFRSRGAGDFLGVKQHGGSSMLNYPITLDIISSAKEIAHKLLQNKAIKELLLKKTSQEKTSFIKNLTLN